MAREVYDFQVTVTAGTTKANPQVTDLAMPPRTVVAIEFIVPPGPRGLMGFRLGSGGLQILPTKAGQWLITDNEKTRWELSRQIDSGAWQCIAHNTGKFDHTFDIRFLCELPAGLDSSAGLVLLPAAALSQVGS